MECNDTACFLRKYDTDLCSLGYKEKRPFIHVL